jgi:hypothetical protein
MKVQNVKKKKKRKEKRTPKLQKMGIIHERL